MSRSSHILAAALALWAAMPTAIASLADLTRRYTRDDQLLDGALRYERNQADTCQRVWVLETGELVKAATTTKTAESETTDEFSLTADGDVYFIFHQVRARQADGGTRITEERVYFEEFQAIQFSHRTADVPAGAAAEIPAKTPSIKRNLEKLTDEQRSNEAANKKSKVIIAVVRDPKFLVHDPAKDAPADWQRIKLVEGTLSPDGRHALAWAPAKKDFVWSKYLAEESTDDYWVEPEAEPVVNFIADLKTHGIAGKTPGVHFGVKQNYNHYECIMAWSPDSRIFIELNTRKWDYAVCCIGRVTDGKLAAVQDLGAAVGTRAKEYLKTTKHKGYRKHAKEMVVALAEPKIENDGTGSIKAIFQVPKSEEDDACATLRVRFRLTAGKNQLEMVGAELLKDD